MSGDLIRRAALVRSLTVAKSDSIGLVVFRLTQCSHR